MAGVYSVGSDCAAFLIALFFGLVGRLPGRSCVGRLVGRVNVVRELDEGTHLACNEVDVRRPFSRTSLFG